MLSVLASTTEPLLRPRALRWLVLLGLLGADAAAAWLLPRDSPARPLANDVVLLLVIVGASNVWAQSGVRARDAAVLGLGLPVYDGMATSVLGQTGDLLRHVANGPFAPLVAWPLGPAEHWEAIGLGDLLLVASFPLVLRKAFGRSAGLLGLAVALGVLVTLLALPLAGTFPVMVVLGPLMALQYVGWMRSTGGERTTWQYQYAEAGRPPRANHVGLSYRIREQP
jgi:hypothetical protein